MVKPLTLCTLAAVGPIFQAVHATARVSATLPPIVQAIWLDGSGA
jgi:hypothetical protein